MGVCSRLKTCKWKVSESHFKYYCINQVFSTACQYYSENEELKTPGGWFTCLLIEVGRR